MWQYKGMLFNPRYGRVGLIAMPFFTFGEMIAPLIEVMGYIVTAVGLALGVVNTSFALLFLLVAWGYGMLLSDRKSTRLNSSHGYISYAVFCLKKKKKE